ncbi:GH12 family glycosyl hydrolase domain-containing protein [Planosporangium sp. 12N6]|uniref:GH12 family glycosyl hydrolase domain-containing protein n=1 Tax=Planosporangium spinosum TaxID=3402278 RepID=UPI003CE7933A
MARLSRRRGLMAAGLAIAASAAVTAAVAVDGHPAAVRDNSVVTAAGNPAAAVGGAPVDAIGSTTHVDTRICDKTETTTIQDQYVVMNNVWGADSAQCIHVTDKGFTVAADHGKRTDGAPASYPAVYYGCHYTNCSNGTNLPMQVSKVKSATSSISYTHPTSGAYDVAYDIWLDPAPKEDGVNQQELMIWLNHQGGPQPVGTKTGTVTLGGRSWDVWIGNNGMNDVVSYVASSPVTSLNFSVLDFVNDIKKRSKVTDAWYLTSIQAGFEPWQGGTGLAITSFAASVNGVGGGAKPPAPQSCTVSYAPTSWTDGFTTTVSITNTTRSTIHGWKLAFPFAGDQKITKAWTSTVKQSGNTVTAADAGYNGSIPANGSVSFVLQGTHGGANPSPTAFNLNGTTCTTA